MDAIEAVCSSLPDSAGRVRRRFWCDPEFRSVCEDYRDALQVLAKLDLGRSADAPRIAEYRQIVTELLAEVKTMLKTDKS